MPFPKSWRIWSAQWHFIYAVQLLPDSSEFARDSCYGGRCERSRLELRGASEPALNTRFLFARVVYCAITLFFAFITYAEVRFVTRTSLGPDWVRGIPLIVLPAAIGTIFFLQWLRWMKKATTPRKPKIKLP